MTLVNMQFNQNTKRKTHMDIKSMIQNKQVTFVRYQNNELWYVTECGFEFPVPLSDTGNAAFLKTDKAMLYMRWIRKHVEMLKTAQKVEQEIV